MRKTAWLLALALLAAGIAVAAPARADEVPAGATWQELYFESDDGTMLHADVLLPKDRRKNERHPVILSIGPYFGTGLLNGGVAESGPIMRFLDFIEGGDIFAKGYAWVQVDSRGFGGSDGCNDFGGPGEQMDAKAAIEWAAKQKWSNGNVGLWGKSYDAWTQVMALAQKPKGLAAAVIQAPLIETYRGMFMNGVHYGEGWYATPSLYAAFDLTPQSVNDSSAEEFLYPAKGTATNPDCYAENLAFTTVPEYDIPYWQERAIVKAAARSKVPVIWSHGFNDANTKASNFMPVWTKLRGPKRAWFGQWAHDRGNEVEKVGRDGFIEESMAWFDHYLKGLPLKRYPAVEIQDGNGDWRSEAAWPPSDARRYDMALEPGSYVDQRGNSARRPQRGSWTFTQPAPHDMHIAGEPVLSAKVEMSVPYANLIAILYDVAPDGSARYMSRGAFLVRGSGKVSFELYPQDWRLEKGHRLGLFMSGSDDGWFTPNPTSQTVTVAKGALSLPYLRFLRANDLEGGAARAMNDVPETQVDNALVKEHERRAAFPPPLRRR